MQTAKPNGSPQVTPLKNRRPAPAVRLTAPPIANATDAIVREPLISLFAGQFIQAGEIVQFVIKPSRWLILFNSLLFSASVVLIIWSLHFMQWQMLISRSASLQLTIFLIAGRLMWSVLQWMGRYYILTDLRVIRLSGVFDVQIASIPLRKVSEARLYRSISERVLGKGSIEVLAPELPMVVWHAVSKPVEIHERVVAAVRKAQQNGHPHP